MAMARLDRALLWDSLHHEGPRRQQVPVPRPAVLCWVRAVPQGMQGWRGAGTRQQPRRGSSLGPPWVNPCWMLPLLGFFFVGFFFHFYPSQGEKAQEVPGELWDASPILCVPSGDSPPWHGAAEGWRAVPRGWGTAHLLLPRGSSAWGRSTSQGCKAKPKKEKQIKLKIMLPNILLPFLKSGHLPTPASRTPFSCHCRT